MPPPSKITRCHYCKKVFQISETLDSSSSAICEECSAYNEMRGKGQVSPIYRPDWKEDPHQLLRKKIWGDALIQFCAFKGWESYGGVHFADEVLKIFDERFKKKAQEQETVKIEKETKYWLERNSPDAYYKLIKYLQEFFVENGERWTSEEAVKGNSYDLIEDTSYGIYEFYPHGNEKCLKILDIIKKDTKFWFKCFINRPSRYEDTSSYIFKVRKEAD